MPDYKPHSNPVTSKADQEDSRAEAKARADAEAAEKRQAKEIAEANAAAIKARDEHNEKIDELRKDVNPLLTNEEAERLAKYDADTARQKWVDNDARERMAATGNAIPYAEALKIASRQYDHNVLIEKGLLDAKKAEEKPADPKAWRTISKSGVPLPPHGGAH